ncbi:MAG TPA: tetratricopeptide repeat protein [Gammaproteobacteria bacterium]|nr:tetratricopeptide repeat protein [Gammaproteobacteria bacterium]
MSQTGRITACAILLQLVILLTPFAPLPVEAAARTLSPLTYRQLTGIREQMDRQAWDAALSALQQLIAELDPDSYEAAVTLQMLGHVQVNREAYPEAIRAFAASLALEQLPEETTQRLRYDLAQLYLAEQQPAQASRLLETWFKTAPEPHAEAWLLLGHAYAAQKLYRKAIPPLQRAIKLADSPRAQWYEALLAMHYELQDYRASIPLLEDMIRLFPERDRYWQQLAAVQLALKDDRAAVNMLELAYRDGALKREQDLLQLARLYLYTGIPYKSARLLEEQIAQGHITDSAENRALLAQAWSTSKHREQAILALQKALDKKPDPELGMRLAQWYFDAQRWQAAEQTLQTLIGTQTTGKLAAQAWLLLGIVRYEQGRTDAARTAFSSAGKLADASAAAQQWLRFLDAGN